MLKEIKIKLEGNEYIVKRSYKSLMLFEDITKKTAMQMNESVNDIMILFYCVLKANNKTFDYTLDGFIDAIDNSEDGAMEVFTDYLTSLVEDDSKSTKKKK